MDRTQRTVLDGWVSDYQGAINASLHENAYSELLRGRPLLHLSPIGEEVSQHYRILKTLVRLTATAVWKCTRNGEEVRYLSDLKEVLKKEVLYLKTFAFERGIVLTNVADDEHTSALIAFVEEEIIEPRDGLSYTTTILMVWCLLSFTSQVFGNGSNSEDIDCRELCRRWSTLDLSGLKRLVDERLIQMSEHSAGRQVCESIFTKSFRLLEDYFAAL